MSITSSSSTPVRMLLHWGLLIRHRYQQHVLLHRHTCLATNSHLPVFIVYFPNPSLSPCVSHTAILLCRLQHGLDRGAGCLWEHLGPTAGAFWKFLRPVQKRNTTQSGRAVPLLGIIQQLRTAGPEEVWKNDIVEELLLLLFLFN